MQDAALVRGLKSFGDLFSERHRLVDGKRALLKPLVQPVTLDHLEHQARIRGGILEAIDLGDVRMIEGRQRLSFPMETCNPIRIVREVVGQDLESDISLQLFVMGAEHTSHASFTDEGAHFKRANVTADLYGQFRGTVHNLREPVNFRSEPCLHRYSSNSASTSMAVPPPRVYFFDRHFPFLSFITRAVHRKALVS